MYRYIYTYIRVVRARVRPGDGGVRPAGPVQRIDGQLVLVEDELLRAPAAPLQRTAPVVGLVGLPDEGAIHVAVASLVQRREAGVLLLEVPQHLLVQEVPQGRQVCLAGLRVPVLLLHEIQDLLAGLTIIYIIISIIVIVSIIVIIIMYIISSST